MSSFFSFLTTKKFPSKDELSSFFTPPLTVPKVVLFFLSIISIGLFLSLLLQISNRFTITIPDYGGTLEEGVIGAPRFINPFLAASDTDRMLSTLLFSGLLGYNERLELTPLLAESYTLSPDEKSAQFTLRENLRFSDGSPLTSADILFSYQTYKTLGTGEMQSLSIETPDERTIILTTTADESILSYATKGIVSQTQWSGIPVETFRDSTNNTDPISSGPFTLSGINYKNTVPETITIKRNKHFSGPRPFIDTIRLHSFSNQLAVKAALNDDTITSTSALDPLFIDTSIKEEFSNTSFPLTTTVALYTGQNASQQTIVLLETLGLFIDRKAIIDTIENGYGIPLADTTTTSDSINSGLERLGYTYNEQGTLLRGGVPVRVVIALRKDETLTQTATLIAEWLGTLGIGTELQVFEQGAFMNELPRQTLPLILERTDTRISGYTARIPLYRKTLVHIAADDITLPPQLPITTKEMYWQSMGHWSLATDRVWKWFTKQ